MPKLKGQALYLELVPEESLTEDEIRRLAGWRGTNAVKQVIIFPPSVDDTGREQRGVILTRLVSPSSPRSQWEWGNTTTQKISHLDLEDENQYSIVKHYSKEVWDLLPEATKIESHKIAVGLILRNELLFTDYLRDSEGQYVRDENGNVTSIVKQGWAIRGGKPIAVETTDEDYADLHDKSKTPQAVIRRINKVRDSLADFPAKLV
jgi:hypothetical protein